MTNLEHYFVKVATFDRQTIVLDMCVNSYESWYKSYAKSEMTMVDWLLSPYEEPKPTYKLTQFEYDLLRTAKWSTRLFGEYDYLMNLKAIGYFKDITSAMAIVNVLDNAEVIEE